MDKFVIKLGGSKWPETAKEPEKCKTKVQRDKEYDHKHTWLFKDSWFSNFTWLRNDDSLDTLIVMSVECSCKCTELLHVYALQEL